jgi:hypothetical protein
MDIVVEIHSKSEVLKYSPVEAMPSLIAGNGSTDNDPGSASRLGTISIILKL